MEKNENLEKVCEILVGEVQTREEERNAVISLKIPAEVLLKIIPVWSYGIASLTREAHIMGRDEEYEGLEEQQQYALTKMLSAITEGLTQNDPFKTFDLHAKFSEAGVEVPVDFHDPEEEG